MIKGSYLISGLSLALLTVTNGMFVLLSIELNIDFKLDLYEWVMQVIYLCVIFQHINGTNKANRAKLKFIHTSGTKSFARLCEEEVHYIFLTLSLK